MIALVRRPGGAEAKAIQVMGARPVRGDVTDRASMREAMTGTDVVIHNAGWYEFGITKQERDTMRAINVQGTENTLGLAVELGISKVVYTSTILAFGPTGDIVADETFQRCAPPQTCYEQTKTEVHKLAVALQLLFCREFALAALVSWQFSAAKSERDLGMRYRSLEQAWLDTLEGERAIARKG